MYPWVRLMPVLGWTIFYLVFVPSQVGRGWLQKWFFSQTSGSSWLSLYPVSHWKDTVEPIDRSWLNLMPFTGIPGSIQEYVSSVTTREINKTVLSYIWLMKHQKGQIWGFFLQVLLRVVCCFVVISIHSHIFVVMNHAVYAYSRVK